MTDLDTSVRYTKAWLTGIPIYAKILRSQFKISSEALQLVLLHVELIQQTLHALNPDFANIEKHARKIEELFKGVYTNEKM